MNQKPSSFKRKRSASTLVLALITFWVPVTFSSPVARNAAPFCACCAEPGEWSLKTHKIDDYQMKELDRLTVDGTADFSQTDEMAAHVSGVTAPADIEYGNYVISMVHKQRNWKLVFKTSKGEAGALVLTIPGTATFFDADIGQERSEAESLYKEIRMRGDVRGTGIFAKGMTPKTKYRLVLQGKGNWCMSAENFNRWNLRVSGPRARYTIYGYFAKPSKAD